MADIRINSLPTTASASSSDDFLALDGATNGTRKLNAYSPTFGGNLTVSGTGNSSVAGNLGIGETSPVVPLHVKTTGTGTGDFDNAIATLRSTAAGRTITLQFSDTTNQSYISSKSGALNFGVGGATLGMSLSSGGNLTVSGTGTSSFAGSLGIATTSPNKSSFSTAVTVNGATNSGFEVAVGDTRIAGFYAASSIAVLNAFANVPLAFSTNNTTQMQLFANGNLFVGASPTDGGQKLQVSGTGLLSANLGGNGFVLNVNNVGGNAVLQLMGSTAASHLRTLTNGSLNLITGGTDGSLGTTALTLDSSQNATFAGTSVTVDGASTGSTLTLKRASNANGAIISYKTTTTSKWYHGLRGLVDDNWYLQNDVAGNTALFFDASTSNATFAGNINAGGASNDADIRLHLNAAGTTSAKYAALWRNSSSTKIFHLRADGDLYTSAGATITGAIAIGNTVQTAVGVASTHKVTISIGGTTYYLLATNV